MALKFSKEEMKIIYDSLFRESKMLVGLIAFNRQFPEAEAHWKEKLKRVEALRFKIEEWYEEDRKNRTKK